MTIVSASAFFGSKTPQLAKPQIVDSLDKRAGATEFAKGVGKGALGTVHDVSAFNAGPVGEAMLNNAPELKQRVMQIRSMLEPSNPAQKAGLLTERVAEAIVPSSMVKNAATGVAKTMARAAGRGVEQTGQKIQQAVIRPTIADIKDGFNIENVAKYDVGGSLPETITKSHTKINALGERLKGVLTSTDNKIDLNDTLSETAKRLGADKAGTFGDNAALDRVLDQIQDEVLKTGALKHDLWSANLIKRAAGSKGAWAYNRPEPDASAIEKAYTTFYGVLKEQIEKAAPEGVKGINRELSELITIQNAALRRLPVEQRNNLFSLTDSLGVLTAVFDPRALLLVGATRAARSGRVGNTITKVGRKMQGKKMQ